MPNGPSVWPNRCEFYRTKRILKTAGFLYIILMLWCLFIYLYFVNIGIYTVCSYTMCVLVLLLCTKTVQLINTLNIQKGRVKCQIDVSTEPHWHVHQKIWAVFLFFLFFYSTHLRIIVRRILLYCSKSFNQVPVSMSQSYYWQCLRQ